MSTHTYTDMLIPIFIIAPRYVRLGREELIASHLESEHLAKNFSKSKAKLISFLAQLAGAVEYTNCISAEG